MIYFSRLAMVLMAQFSSLSTLSLSFAEFSGSLTSQKPSVETQPAPKKCQQSSVSSAAAALDLSYPLMMFVSFSVPLSTWKEASPDLEKLGGAFLIRGLPGSSFEELRNRILELRKEGIKAPILLDPQSFITYSIKTVPTLILKGDTSSHEDNPLYDQVSGNIPISEALRLIAEKGTTQDKASHLLNILRRSSL